MDFAAVKKLVESSPTTTAIKEEDHVVKNHESRYCLSVPRLDIQKNCCLMTDTLRRGVGTAIAAEAARLNARAEDN